MKNYRLGLYEKAMPSNLTLLQKLEAAKAAGFDYMEISIDETDDRQSRLRWTADARAVAATLRTHLRGRLFARRSA